MEKEFVPYEQALALKELGFDEPCLAKYQKLSEAANYQLQLLKKEKNCNRLDTAISAPLYQQAFRWFREEYNHNSNIFSARKGEKDISFDIFDIKYFTTSYISTVNYKTYEEAELECFKKLIELCQEN